MMQKKFINTGTESWNIIALSNKITMTINYIQKTMKKKFFLQMLLVRVFAKFV